MDNKDDFSFDWDLSQRSLSSKTPRESRDSPHKKTDHHENKSNNENLCAVCLSGGEDTMLLPCTHQFHGKCILRWVDQNFSCPLCRKEIAQFIPLNAKDKKIHQQFVDIWERHHYAEKNESEKKDDPATASDNFNALKPRQISASEVARLEEESGVTQAIVIECDSGDSDSGESYVISSSDELIIAEEDITITGSRILEITDEIVDTSEVLISLDVDRYPQVTGFAILLSQRNIPTAFLFSSSRPLSPKEGVAKSINNIGKRIFHNAVNYGSSLVAQSESEVDIEETPIATFSLARPTIYNLNESLEAGFLAGFLTAFMLATTQPRNLYPIVREVVPNVAIFFTVYEDLKYRNLNPNTDTSLDCFFKKTLSAGVAATLAQLTHNQFKCTVPIRFGLQFGFFEFFKDQLCVMQGHTGKDHSKLSPLAIAASASSGGVIAATCAFPVELYMKYMEVGKASYLHAYKTSMRKFLPGCVFTALSFEFGRRWIHNHEDEDDT